MAKPNRPADITLLSLLFLFVALLCAMCGLGILLPPAEPHPFLRMIPALALLGTEALSWLVFVCLACVVAALGLWRCSYWGYLAAILVVFCFLVTHFLRALFTNQWTEILVILTTAALIALYLRRRARLFVHRTAGP